LIKLVHSLAEIPFRGRGLSLRTLARLFPSLRQFPLSLTPATTIRVDLRDNSSIGIMVHQGIGHERGLLALLQRFLTPGDVFYDIGANLGYYTCIFAEPQYELLRIVAFEPNPGLAAQLERNTAERSNVLVIPAGLSSRPGVADFRFDPMKSGLGNFRPGAGKSTCSVKLETLDGLIEAGHIPAPDVVKMDVEGLEYRVLEGYGARDDHRPAIFMEWSDVYSSAVGVSFGDLQRLLGESWVIYRVENDGTLRSEEIATPRTTNDLLLTWRGGRYHEIAESFVRNQAAV